MVRTNASSGDADYLDANTIYRTYSILYRFVVNLVPEEKLAGDFSRKNKKGRGVSHGPLFVLNLRSVTAPARDARGQSETIYQNLFESNLSLAIRQPVRAAVRVETILRTLERSRSRFL